MGTGSGAGVGTGKGVKGGWRVSAFLLFLTGWQAVLLPWSPLILRDAGFSPTKVGLLSGSTTLAASVGVVVSLRGIRRSRSGAMRRLLLWLLFAGATLLQGCCVLLLLQSIPYTGLLQSSVSGWPFTPTTAVIPLDTSTPSAMLPLRPQSLAPIITTNSPSTTNTTTSISIASSLIPFNFTLTTTTKSKSTTVPPLYFPSLHPAAIATLPLTSATAAHDATVPTADVTSTPKLSNITTPAIHTDPKTYGKISVNGSAINVQSLSSGYPKEDEKYHENEEDEAIDTGGSAEKTPKMTNEKIKAAHKSKAKGSHKSAHKPYVSLNDSEQDKMYQMNTKNINKPSHDNDQRASQENYSDNDIYQIVDESDSSEEKEDKMDEVINENIPPKHMNDYSRQGGKASPPSSGFHDGAQAGRNIKTWNLQPQSSLSKHESVLQNYPDSNFFFPKKSNRNGEFALPSNDQMDKQPHSITNLRPHHRLPPPKVAHPHYLMRPLHPAFTSRAETHVVPGGDRQYDDYDGQIRSRHTKNKRSRRSMHHTDSGDHFTAKADTNETGPQQNKSSNLKWNPVEGMDNMGLKAGVAVLLALGGLLGAGVEASVAQLWHCYVHGYDEGGVSQDILQRTITHTFHLSTYGCHRSWSGITSGAWVMVAGVVSILAFLAGTAESGYMALAGVHLALGLASLLVLLVLPVPYGSIDPPKTRRPLSLYLDDEVLREGVRRLTFHLWVFVNGCLAAFSLTFSLWLLQDMTSEGWVVGSQAAAVGVTLACESLALHTQRCLVTRWGLHGLMGACEVNLMVHFGVMCASESVAVVVVAHVGLGVAMAFLWVAVKHNALLLATVSDQEREAWASWWCWRFGLVLGAAAWGVGVSSAGGKVRPLLPLAALTTVTLTSVLCVATILSRRSSRTRRRVYHTLDLDMAEEEDDVEEDAAENDWLVKRAKKEGLSL